jgi:exopolysaccharide biosynthesis polyprenyl glycosylphosphotransferase
VAPSNGGIVARVGRPERPLDVTSGPVARLAGELRRLRDSRTYRELADITELSIATLQAATKGEKVPTWKVTHAFITACGGDEGMVQKLWEDARAAAGRPVPGDRPGPPPVPRAGEVTSVAKLIAMMKQLRRWDGNPSFAQLNERSGGFHLPPSTVSDMLRSQKLPRLELVSAYVRAFHLDEEQAAAWEQAWHELNGLEFTEQQLLAPQRPQESMSDYIDRVASSGWARSTWARDYLRRAAVADLGSAILGVFAAAEFRFSNQVTGTYITLSLTLPVLWLVAIWLAGGYDVRFIGTGSDEFRKVLNAGMGLTLAVAVFSYAVNLELSRGYVLIALPITTLFDLASRYAIRKRLHRQRAVGRYMQSVVAVGHESAVADLVNELHRDPYHGLTVVGACVVQPSEGAEIAGVRVYGGLDDVTDAVHAFGAGTVAVLACPEMDSIRLRSLAWELEKTGTDLCVAPALLDVAGPRTTIRPTAGLSLLHIDHPQLSGIRVLVKGLFDRGAAAAALIMLTPLLMLLGLTIWLSDRGPALFTQVRVGKDGRVFRIYKFRTMVVDAEQRRAELLASNDTDGVLFKLRRDPRVTAVGAHLRRWSIDELPQLINVILGDMSLVGPRPALPFEAAQYAEHVRRRLIVKPGLTGLWQVNGRSDLSWAESVRLDLRYVENWSFALDLQILWRTCVVIWRGSGAY